MSTSGQLEIYESPKILSCMKFNQHMIMLFVYFTQQGIWDQIPYGIFHCLLVGFEFLDYW